MLASAKTLKNSANWQWIKRLHLNSIKAQQVIAWFICLNILAHGFIWWDFMILSNNDAYIKNVRQALSLIPPEASVKAPKNLVAYVANRRDYFLLEDKRSGDFMIMDTDEQYNIYTNNGNSKEYTCLFHEQSIRLLKKNMK